MRSRSLFVFLITALLGPAAVAAAQPAGAAAVSSTPSWTSATSGWDRSSSPTVADVNGDGVNDIVIGHENGLLHVIDAASGRDISGWPQQTGTAIDSTPAVGDLFNDGRKEIVVGLGSTFVPNQQGGVKIYNANGSLHCTYRTADYFNIWTNSPHPDGYSDGVYSSPAIGDINGDGFPDVVFGGFDLHIHAIDRNCHQIMSDNVEDTVWSSPALYDINGDGRLDILIGGDQTAGGSINWSGGEFRAIEYTGSSTVSCSHCREIWKHQLNDTMWSSPAVGDIDGDGRPEVIVGGGNYYNRSDGRKVFAWHLDDGSGLHGWPVSTSGSTASAPALGDLNGNGIPEVVASSADGYVRAFNANGSVRWATRLWAFTPKQAGGPAASPIIADMNGDGQPDVVVGNNFGVFVLNGANGSIMTTLDTYSSFDASPAVGNFGRAGWRLILAGFNTPNKTSTLQRVHDARTTGDSLVADVPPRRAPSRGPGRPPPAARGSVPSRTESRGPSRGEFVTRVLGPRCGRRDLRVEGRAVLRECGGKDPRYRRCDGGDALGARLLRPRQQRGHLPVRRRALVRFDGGPASQPTDHRSRADRVGTGLLVAGVRRRRVQFR